MSKFRKKNILDDNFKESIESHKSASLDIIILISIFIGTVFISLLYQKGFTHPSFFYKYIHYFIISLALILYPIFIWLNDKKYIFTPDYIISTSFFFSDKRIDNLIGYRNERERYQEGNHVEFTQIIIIIHKNGSIRIAADSFQYANFYSIQKFVEKHYELITDW